MATHALDFLASNNLKGSKKYTWERIFASPFPTVVGALAPYAERADCTQLTEEQTIFWLDKNQGLKAMFCLVPDPSELDLVREVYERVAKRKPLVTFVIVHQKKDGVGNYDIFRLSPLSYLEHHNRVFDKSK